MIEIPIQATVGLLETQAGAGSPLYYSYLWCASQVTFSEPGFYTEVFGGDVSVQKGTVCGERK